MELCSSHTQTPLALRDSHWAACVPPTGVVKTVIQKEVFSEGCVFVNGRDNTAVWKIYFIALKTTFIHARFYPYFDDATLWEAGVREARTMLHNDCITRKHTDKLNKKISYRLSMD